MTTRFVYPTYDNVFGNCLRINRADEDGSIWFGVKDAITNYLKENGLDIKNIEWQVKIYDDYDHDYVKIVADSVDDWMNKYDKALSEMEAEMDTIQYQGSTGKVVRKGEAR